MAEIYNIGASPSYPPGTEHRSPYLGWVEDASNRALGKLQDINPQAMGNGTSIGTIANPIAPAPGFGRSVGNIPQPVSSVLPGTNVANNTSLPQTNLTSPNNIPGNTGGLPQAQIGGLQSGNSLQIVGVIAASPNGQLSIIPLQQQTSQQQALQQQTLQQQIANMRGPMPGGQQNINMPQSNNMPMPATQQIGNMGGGSIPNMSFLVNGWDAGVTNAARRAGIFGKVFIPTVGPHVDPVANLPYA